MEEHRLPHAAFTGEEIRNFPTGVVFVPTDEELITHYLGRKLRREGLPWEVIRCDDVYKYNPQDLPEVYEPNGFNKQNREPCWFFFTTRERKYPKGSRPRRTANGGFWKATGADEKIFGPRNSVIGFKKSLVFHDGTSKSSRKTHWMMKEFKVKDEESKKTVSEGKRSMTLDDCVLCKIYCKGTVARSESSPSGPVPVESSSFPIPRQILDPSSSTSLPIQEQHPAVQIEQVEAGSYDPTDHFTVHRQPSLNLLALPPLPGCSCCFAQQQSSSSYLMNYQWPATDFVVDGEPPMAVPPLGFMVGSDDNNGGAVANPCMDLLTSEIPIIDNSDLTVQSYDQFDDIDWFISPPSSPPAASEDDPSDNPSNQPKTSPSPPDI